MALRVRKLPDDVVFALVAAWNAKQEAAVASFFHADITQLTTPADYKSPVAPVNDVITSANATDLPTSLTIVNEEKAVLNRHFQDPRAHNTAVTAVVATVDATDLATAITLANAIKAAYNTHRTAAGLHFTNDATNVTAAADSTDQTSLNTLVNEIKTDFNAHVISAPTGYMLNLVDA